MRKRKISICLLLICTLLISFAGCKGTSSENESDDSVSEEEQESGSDTVTIGMSFDSFLIERWERDRDVFVTTAKEAGVEVNVQNANGDINTQIEQISYFIKKKVDAIVIVAIDARQLYGVVAEAKAAGIPVIAYDRMLTNAGADLYVSFDNERVGELMAESLSEKKNVKKVMMLSGPTEDTNVPQVNEGFARVCKTKGIRVTDTFYTPNWTPETAADYLREHPEMIDETDAIMCGNDNIATQVVRVLSERKKAGTIEVTGQDADLEACQRIIQGTQLMTVYKPVEKQAKAAAEATVSIINGKEPREISKTISDGTYDVPAIILEPVAVNKENMDKTIVESGFHSHDEVYLFAPQ